MKQKSCWTFLPKLALLLVCLLECDVIMEVKTWTLPFLWQCLEAMIEAVALLGDQYITSELNVCGEMWLIRSHHISIPFSTALRMKDCWTLTTTFICMHFSWSSCLSLMHEWMNFAQVGTAIDYAQRTTLHLSNCGWMACCGMQILRMWQLLSCLVSR